MKAGGLKTWLAGKKDASVSFVAEKLLRKRLERYGELLELRINSRERSAVVEMLPRGELEPVRIDVHRYEIGEEDGALHVTLAQASASRAWLTLLLQDFVLDRRFPIPEQYASVAKLLL